MRSFLKKVDLPWRRMVHLPRPIRHGRRSYVGTFLILSLHQVTSFSDEVEAEVATEATIRAIVGQVSNVALVNRGTIFALRRPHSRL